MGLNRIAQKIMKNCYCRRSKLVKALIKTIYRHAYVSIPNPHLMILAIYLRVPSVFLPLLDYYSMMSECSYSWCVVSLFVTSLCCLRLFITLAL